MKLQEILSKKVITQRELAFKLELSQPCISKWCRNESTPSIETMQKLADILGVSLKTIVDCFVKSDETKNQKGEK